MLLPSQGAVMFWDTSHSAANKLFFALAQPFRRLTRKRDLETAAASVDPGTIGFGLQIAIPPKGIASKDQLSEKEAEVGRR